LEDVLESLGFGSGGDGTTDLALGDFDKDGNLDVVCVNLGEWNVVYFGDGDGSFDTRSQTLGFAMDFSMAVAVGDVNNDTNLDIVVGNLMDYGDVYLGNGDGTFQAPINFGQNFDFTIDLALGDVNKDGDLDIVRADDGFPNYVYLGDGDGTFDTTSYTWGTGSDVTWAVALGDVNNDTKLDIISGDNGGQNVVYIGDGDGTFDTTSYNFGTGSDATAAIGLEDVNYDTYLDIITGNIGEQNVVYLGDGDGTFDSMSNNFGSGTDYTYSVVLLDMNEDNIVDIVAANDFDGITGTNYIFYGAGDGTFTISIGYGSGIDPSRALAKGDINNDLREDFVCGNVYDMNHAYFQMKYYTINLSWDPVIDPEFDGYFIYRSSSRDGLNLLSLQPVASTTNTVYSDLVPITGGNQFYYAVCALSTSDIMGYNSSYSLGIWFSDYDKGYESFGLPLEPLVQNTMDWYCDQISNSVGMNYYIDSESRWSWHATRMPSGAYDPIIEMAKGYQLSTDDATKYTFIGI
jgi:hypothetical protein